MIVRRVTIYINKSLASYMYIFFAIILFGVLLITVGISYLIQCFAYS